MPVAESLATHSIAQQLLAEFEAQAPVTRRFLERLPNDKLTWKPHEKSMTAGQLAYHLAFVPGGVARASQSLRNQPPAFNHPQPSGIQEVLNVFDESIAAVRQILPQYDDAAMNETWRVVNGDREIIAMPRHEFLHQIGLNHWYQHRGQFSVYLRLLGIAVPASWGPSADENPFAPRP